MSKDVAYLVQIKFFPHPVPGNYMYTHSFDTEPISVN